MYFSMQIVSQHDHVTFTLHAEPIRKGDGAGTKTYNCFFFWFKKSLKSLC
jgi:hypothetical protein